MTYLVEITDLIDGTVVVHRYSDGGYTSAPTDTPPNAWYQPRIKRAANYGRSIRGAGGRATAAGGEMVLIDTDGGLDGLTDATAGRLVQIRRLNQDRTLAGSTLILTGIALQPERGLTTVTLKLRDMAAALAETQVQEATYGGTTTDGTLQNADGRPSDIGGRVKPLCYGACYSVAPAPVDVYHLMYQVHDGPVAAIPVVRDRGVALTPAADYPTMAALYAATTGEAGSGADIERGRYGTCLAAGLFKLGGMPFGAITADVLSGLAPADRTAAAVMRTLVEGAGHAVDGDALAALAASVPAEIGLYLDRETTIAAALDMVAESIGAWWAFDRAGVWTCGRLDRPAEDAVPVAEFGVGEIFRKDLSRSTGDHPVKTIKLRYAPYWSALTESDIAGDVDASLRAELIEPWRTAEAADATVAITYPLAQVTEVESLIADQAAAQAEAARLLALLSVPSARYKIAVPLELASRVQLGSIIKVTLPRWGMNAGKNLLVVGIEEDTSRHRAIIEGWR